MADKYTTMIEYLRQCPSLQGILGFQAVQASDGALRVLTTGSDSQAKRTYIDGSVLRQFDFVIEFYKVISNVPYLSDEDNTNIADIMDVQAVIEWLDDQSSSGNLPNFGASYTVDCVRSLNDQPNLSWLDAVNYDPPLAKYTLTIRVEYVDYTRSL